MMNMMGVDADLSLAQIEMPGLGLGVHLTLTAGSPVSRPEMVGSLVDGDGKFWSLDQFIRRLDEIRLDEVQLEWRAQAEHFVKQTGKLPTHFDSHHHSSNFNLGLFRLILELAQEYRCAIRYGIPPVGELDSHGITEEVLEKIRKSTPDILAEYSISHPDLFIGSFYGQTATRETLLAMVNNLREGVSELMCHPGYVDGKLLTDSTYNVQREHELEILTDPEIVAAVRRNEIELISFGEIPNKMRGEF
jgi:predicted glycoside hydrolase/deacetylase ChbG (UPF0249 family)